MQAGNGGKRPSSSQLQKNGCCKIIHCDQVTVYKNIYQLNGIAVDSQQHHLIGILYSKLDKLVNNGELQKKISRKKLFMFKKS